jgi:hypothetical protein
MQTSGGYRYPGAAVCGILTAVAVVATLLITCIRCMPFGAAMVLFLNLEGTVLLASAFTPVGLTPPQGALAQRVKWFFAQTRSVSVSFSQPMFYAGLLLCSWRLVGALW